MMNQGARVVESKDVRFDEVRGPTVAHRDVNVIEFDLSDANIFVDDLQAAHDGGNEHENIRNEDVETDNANEVDADAPVDDMGKNEGEQTDKVSAECEGSGDDNYDVNRDRKDDSTNTSFEIDLDDLTNIPTLRRSETLTAVRPPNKYGFEQYHLVQEHISDTHGVPKTYTEAITSRFSKERMEAMRSEITSVEKLRTWNFDDLHKVRNVVQTKWVLDFKRNGKANFIRHKARLFAKGFSQIPVIDFLEVFSRVSIYATVLFMVALSVK